VSYKSIGDRHYVEEGWSGTRSTHVNTEIWGKVVRDNVVVSCADVVVVNNVGKILLVRRNIQPLKGEYWVIGGKRNPGEARAESAQRHFKRDTRLNLLTDRFRYIDVYSTVFAVRNEPPQTNGSHTDNFTFAVVLLPEETATIQLDPREYEDENAWQWFLAEDIITMVKAGKMHPALADIVRDMRTKNIIP